MNSIIRNLLEGLTTHLRKYPEDDDDIHWFDYDEEEEEIESMKIEIACNKTNNERLDILKQSDDVQDILEIILRLMIEFYDNFQKKYEFLNEQVNNINYKYTQHDIISNVKYIKSELKSQSDRLSGYWDNIVSLCERVQALERKDRSSRNEENN
jgi:hypothetical protein